jgi:hypothetical protein
MTGDDTLKLQASDMNHLDHANDGVRSIAWPPSPQVL